MEYRSGPIKTEVVSASNNTEHSITDQQRGPPEDISALGDFLFYYQIKTEDFTNHTVKSESSSSPGDIHQYSQIKDGAAFQINNEKCSNDVDVIQSEVVSDCRIINHDRVNKTYSTSFDLKKNEKLHSVVSGYKCDECDKILATKCSLRNHKFTHMDVITWPHKCDVCGKCFKQNYELVEHGNVHTGDLPYKCTVCGNAYAFKHSLRMHAKIHTKPVRKTCINVNKPNSSLPVISNNFNDQSNKTNDGSNCTEVITKQDSGFTDGCNSASGNEGCSTDAYDSDVTIKEGTHLVGIYDAIVTEKSERKSITGNADDTMKHKDCITYDNLQEKITDKNGVSNTADIHHAREVDRYSADDIVKIENSETLVALYNEIEIEKKSQTDDENHIRKVSTVEVCNDTDYTRKMDDDKNDENEKTSYLKEHIASPTKEKKHKCSECGRSFVKAYQLRRHALLHTGNLPFKCHICAKTFRFISEMHAHVNLHRGIKSYNCKECGKNFMSKCSLKYHRFTHMDVEDWPYKCDLCSRRFKQNFELVEHRNIHTGEKPYACTICGAAYPFRHSLKMHSRVHLKFAPKPTLHNDLEISTELPYKCFVCSEGFCTESEVNVHVQLHCSVNKYQCKFCNKNFASSSSLKNHRLTHVHAEAWPFKCDECGKRFKQNYQLEEHKNLHTGSRPYICGVCGKTYRYKHSLRVHTKIHTKNVKGHNLSTLSLKNTENLRYDCAFPAKENESGSNVKMHVKSQNKEKVYTCDFCSKHFGSRCALKKHSFKHMDETTWPYKCNVCEKRFKYNFELVEHGNIHTGERPYICSICGNAYRYKHSLRVHAKVHGKYVGNFQIHRLDHITTENLPYNCPDLDREVGVGLDDGTHEKMPSREKIYKCETCNKHFASSSAMKTHKFIHMDTANWPYKCDLCGKRFKKNCELIEHGNVHTGERPYFCNICDKTYHFKHSLRMHAKIHVKLTTESKLRRPKRNNRIKMKSANKCCMCGKQFSTKDALKKHSFKHVDKATWPFKCDVCEKRFRYNFELEEHGNVHTGERPYLCSVCGNTYRFKHSLRVHAKLHKSLKDSHLHPRNQKQRKL